MNNLNLLIILIGVMIGLLITIAYFLKRILNILIMKNKGEPSRSEMTKMSFEQMALKKKG